MKMHLFSPAKLNLFFRVLNKRKDGFHEIASLYQAISFGDLLTVSLAEKDRLTCSNPDLACDDSNLVAQAIRAFRKSTGYNHCISVHIQKNVPMQSGLGGGSSNAATVLWALNTLSSQSLSDEQLSGLAGMFSSDAPFFFSSGSAYCQGRGEKIKNIGKIPETKLWIAKPKEGLATPLVYQSCRPSELLQRDPDQYLNDLVEGKPHYFNDLETSAFLLMPSLADLKKELIQLGFSQVTMTGSGTAFFCVGLSRFRQLPGVDFYPASFISRSEGGWYELPTI